MSNIAALKNIADILLKEYPENEAWKGSSFIWIQQKGPGRKHVICRTMLAFLLNANGLTATFYKGQIRVNGNGIAVKTAMMWEEGIIKFQNIRADVDFEFLFCFALFPQKAFGWLIPREAILKDGKFLTGKKGLDDQHEGADAWIDVDPNNPPAWLNKYGGTIDEAVAVAKTSL